MPKIRGPKLALIATLTVALSGGYAAGRYQAWYPCLPSATISLIRFLVVGGVPHGDAVMTLKCNPDALPSAYSPCNFCVGKKMEIRTGPNWQGWEYQSGDHQVNCATNSGPLGFTMPCVGHNGGHIGHRYTLEAFGLPCIYVTGSTPPLEQDTAVL